MSPFPKRFFLSFVPLLLFLASPGYSLEEFSLDDLSQLAVIELKADLDHVQGIAADDSSFWVTSVNRKDKTGHLHHFDSRTGKLIGQTEIHEGERYHPGGLSLDGDFLWIPVAAYRRESEALIQCRDKTTLKQVSQFHVNDHIGCLAVNGEQLIGGNWDSLLLYFWDKQGHLLKKIANPTKTAYQDIKCREGRLIASGLLDDRGCIDWIDLAAMQPTKRLWGGNTDRGVSFMQEGMAVYGDRLFLMPEDGPSRVFVFQLNAKKSETHN